MKHILIITSLLVFCISALAKQSRIERIGNEVVYFETTVTGDITLMDKADIFCSMLKDAITKLNYNDNVQFIIMYNQLPDVSGPIISIDRFINLTGGDYMAYPNIKTIMIELCGSDFEIDDLLKLCLYARTNMKKLEKNQEFVEWKTNMKTDSFQVRNVTKNSFKNYNNYSSLPLKSVLEKKYFSKYGSSFLSKRNNFYYQNTNYHFVTHSNNNNSFFITPRLFEYIPLKDSRGNESARGLIFTSPFEFYYTIDLIQPKDTNKDNYRIQINTPYQSRLKGLGELSVQRESTKFPHVEFSMFCVDSLGEWVDLSVLYLLSERIVLKNFQEKKDSLIESLINNKKNLEEPYLIKSKSEKSKTAPTIVIVLLLIGSIIYIFKPN